MYNITVMNRKIVTEDGLEVYRKSYYNIHGVFPVGDQMLPGDGLFFHLDRPGESTPQCECEQCNFQRKYMEEFHKIELLERQIKSIRLKIKKDHESTTT